MKHLYLLVILLLALTSSTLSTAQIVPNVTFTNDNNSTCSGTATAAPTGGAGGYGYIWSNGQTTSSISNLCAGSYDVIIQDANQDTVSFSFTITDPCSYLTATLSVTNCTYGNCDGSISFIPANGPPPITWEWSTIPGSVMYGTLNNLCPGTYSVTCTDMAGCYVSANVTITDPCTNFTSTLSSTQAANSATCDGSITFNAVGGTAPFTYEMNASGSQTSNVFDSLCAGPYTILCFDASGCVRAESVTITNSGPAPIAANLTTQNDITGNCSGSASAAPTGGAGSYSYLWNTGETTSSISNLCAGSYYVIIQDANQDTASFYFTITNQCSNIALSASVTNCNPGNCDGFIQTTVSGGTGPYAFSISGGPQTGQSLFSNLCHGTYTITVVDPNGCTAVATATLTDTCSTFTGTFSSTPASGPAMCDGTITCNPINGTAPYYYSWDNGVIFNPNATASNLCAGTYDFICMDSIGCTLTQDVLITDSISSPSNISANLTSSDDITGNCSGSASFAPTGGSGPYSYAWSTGATTNSVNNLCAGSYTVTVWDATDTVTVNFNIQNPCTNLSGIITYISPSGIGMCDGSITALPSGGLAPYTLLWSVGATAPSVTNLCAGTYNISVICTDANGCNVILSDSIVLTPIPCGNFTGTTSAIFASNPNSCDGSASVTPVNGTAPYTYIWSNGAATAAISNLCTGSYTVTLEDSNGCGVTLTVLVYDSIGTISNFSANLASTDDFTGNCSGSASVSTSGGIAPYTMLWSTGDNGASITNLCAGIYSVTVWDSGTDSTTVDFVIADSSSTYTNNPYPNGAINDTLYTDLVTNCIIDYIVIDSASLYQAVYSSSAQSLYVTWAVYSPTDTVYISDTLALIGNPGYYSLTISVFCPNKSGNDFFKIESVIYFDGSNVWMSTLGIDEQDLLDHVSIYPNPFSNSISVDNKDGVIQSMKLIDLNGRTLSEMSDLNSGLVELNQLESVSSGTYLLILKGENSSKTYKVIK